MSGSAERWNHRALMHALEVLCRDDPRGEIRAWLADHAPDSRAATEMDILRMFARGAATSLRRLEPVWTDIARAIEGDDSTERAVAFVKAWRPNAPKADWTPGEREDNEP